jgi:hypothetical protein
MRSTLQKLAILSSIIGIFVSATFTNIYTRAASHQDSTIVNIDIQDNLCIFNITVKPEKRLPTTNNWGTLLTVEILDLSGFRIGTLQGRSNNFGQATFDICAQGVAMTTNTSYNFYIRGLSHLRKYYPNVNIVLGAKGANDFSVGGTSKLLLAGETSVIFDNYINSLDLSTQAKNFRRTDDEKDDLNRDGIVNALDISNTAYNFRKVGD